jgi:hypothetical protein
MVLRIYNVFLCLTFTFPIFASAAVNKEVCERLYELVQNGDERRVNSFIKKKPKRDRIDYYDKAIEYSNNMNNKELAELLRMSKIREQERKSKSSFRRHSIAMGCLIGVGSFVIVTLVTGGILLGCAAAGLCSLL